MMKQKGGHGLQARITIDDIPQAKLDLLNSSTVTYEIRDAITGIVESSETRPMRSFTANFLRLLWGRMTGTACTGGLDINDTAIDESSGKATNLKCVGATTGLKKFGICIGTGTGAVSQTDNKLTWDTGFTTYGATTLKTATVISGSDIYFEIQKAFTNNTGSTRTIYEAGLCTTGEGTEADNNTNVLIVRELTNGATGTAVATGKTLTVVFKISSTFTTDGTINKNFMNAIESAFTNNQGAIWNQETSSASFSARNACASVVFGSKILLIGGTDGSASDSVYSSPDGITWTEVRASGSANGFVPRAKHCAWVVGTTIYVGAGRDNSNTKLNSVYKSTDGGATWSSCTAAAAFSARENASYCVIGTTMYIIGGLDTATRNSVYSSTDGITWSVVRADGAGSGFTARQNAKALYFNSKIYIIGGETAGGTAYIDSVYSSSDNGATWTSVRADGAASGFDCKGYVCGEIYNGLMYIFSGHTTGETFSSSCYSSLDGATWTQVGTSLGFGGRTTASSAMLNGKIYIIAGYVAALRNDVWSMMISPFTLQTSTTMPTTGRIDPTSSAVYGITVGTGTTNFAGTDAALVTPIADGSGASQLDYGDMTDAGRLSEPTVSGSDNIMRLERDFTNSSGGSITIKEVGLSAKGLDALGLLLMRGKVDKAVADGASVRVAIELVTTV